MRLFIRSSQADTEEISSFESGSDASGAVVFWCDVVGLRCYMAQYSNQFSLADRARGHFHAESDFSQMYAARKSCGLKSRVLSACKQL
jgi:hypothetical protein